jgi:hypothetical protein
MSATTTSATITTTTNCPYCSKEYSRKTSLNKHVLMCDFLQKSKQAKKIEEEEINNLPSYKELVTIVQELALKNNRLEEKLYQMEKWIETKKKKVNVIQWLNQHATPSTTYPAWCQQIKITSQNLIHLFDNTISDTVIKIIQENLHELLPIYAFDQKTNAFYIFVDGVWAEMSNINFSNLLIKIQNRLLEEINLWRTNNASQLQSNDKMSDTYNKTIMKLMNINSVQDGTVGKIKTGMYQMIKVDIKNMIEYEFEF